MSGVPSSLRTSAQTHTIRRDYEESKREFIRRKSSEFEDI